MCSFPQKIDDIKFVIETLSNDKYVKSFLIFKNDFTAVIEVTNGKIDGKIIDSAFADEFPLFRNEKVVGEFIGNLREEYKNILLDTRKKCAYKVLFPDEYIESLTDMSYSEVDGLSKVKVFPPKKN